MPSPILTYGISDVAEKTGIKRDTLKRRLQKLKTVNKNEMERLGIFSNSTGIQIPVGALELKPELFADPLQEIKCCRCGKIKPRNQINGYDPITGDVSQAYCQRLAECNSDEAHGQMNRLREVLKP